MKDETVEKKLTTADLLGMSNRERREERNEIIRTDNADGAAARDETSMPQSTGAGAGVARETDQNGSLFAAEEGQRFRAQWTEIQTAFVDEPRKAVENADHLVAETIQRLARIFAGERANLEHEWSRGDDRVSTEDLRLALRRYRSFFDRLLSV